MREHQSHIERKNVRERYCWGHLWEMQCVAVEKMSDNNKSESIKPSYLNLTLKRKKCGNNVSGHRMMKLSCAVRAFRCQRTHTSTVK